MRNIFIIDNRRIQSNCFDEEASLNSYHDNVFRHIAQFQILSNSYPSWLNRKIGVAFAASFDTAKIVQDCDVKSLYELLTPRISFSPSNKVSKSWSFLKDALSKLFPSYAQCSSSNKEHCIVSLFVSSHSIMVDNICEPDEPVLISMKEFCRQINKICEQVALVIRFVCVKTSESGSNILDEQARNIQKILSGCSDCIEFSFIRNTPIHFEDEFKQLQIKNVSPIMSILEFPCLGSLRLQLDVEIIASSLEAVSALHGGLSTLEVFSLVPRKSLNPLCIKGNGMSLKPAAKHRYCMDSYCIHDTWYHSYILKTW